MYGVEPSTSASMIGATRGLGDPAQGADLAGQPGAGVGVVGDVLAQHLDRDRAAVPVEREVHHAHPALAEALHEAVLPEARVLTRLLGLVLRLGAVGDGVGGHAHHGKRSCWVDAGPDPHLPGDFLRITHASPGRPHEVGDPQWSVGPVRTGCSAQLVALGLQVVDPVLDHVTDAHDGDELAVDHDRHVPEAPLGHHRLEAVEAVLRARGVHLGGHDLPDRGVEQGRAVGVQVPHDVALTDDAVHALAVVADHDRTDPVLREEGQQLGHRCVGAHGDDLPALAPDHVRDPHAPDLRGASGDAPDAAARMPCALASRWATDHERARRFDRRPTAR